MPREIVKDLYCIELPLPKSPLKSINCYLIKGKKRSLIIDTGMNRKECKDVLFPALKMLDVSLENLDIFLTHIHADHSGMISEVATDSSKCYIGRGDSNITIGAARIETLLSYISMHGFPEEIVKASLSQHPVHHYGPTRKVPLTPVDDGQIITVGDFELKCITTPGHSPGHTCLYDSKRKIFFSGDHILFDITPNITSWPELEDSLRSYLASLDKVADLEVTNVLPGHRKPWHNHQGRIEELKQHHRNRLNEALAALKKGDKTAYAVAPCITWDIKAKDWDDFPVAQKFFAVGETLAHLKYLETDGAIKSYLKNGHMHYTLS